MAKGPLNRRSFLKTAAGAVGAATQANAWTTNPAGESTKPESPADQPTLTAEAPEYPRRFRGRQLTMISFPLGGVAAGSLGLGGRGQLCNWEIFNRPNKGYRPTYAFPSIWVQTSDRPPVARVLESRILPPYEGQDGLGSNNVPGLSRLESAIFTGEYPLAHIEFQDSTLPVKVALHRRRADELLKGSLPELPAVINFGSGDAKVEFAKLTKLRPNAPRMCGSIRMDGSITGVASITPPTRLPKPGNSSGC